MLLASLAAVLTVTALARAQAGSTTAVCTYAEWTLNQKSQSACLVWAELQSLCQTSAVTVGPITGSTAPYAPPSHGTATDCNCNVVAYNLMGGCSWCQPGIYSTDWVSEAQWRDGCSSYDTHGLQASLETRVQAAGIAIPSWALVTVPGVSWVPAYAEGQASSGGSSSGSSKPGGPTKTTSVGRPRITGPFSGDDSGLSDDEVKTWVIVVAVVLGAGLGLPAIASLIALIVFCVRQNNRKKFYGPLAEHYRNGGAPPPELMTQVAPMGAGGMYAPQVQSGYYQQAPISGYGVASYPSPTPWTGSPTPQTVASSPSIVSSSPPQTFEQPGSPPPQQQLNPWNPFHQQQLSQGSPVSGGIDVQPNGNTGTPPPMPPPGAYVHGPQPGVPLV